VRFTARFLWRTLGIELTIVVVATIVLTAIAGLVTQNLIALTPPAACVPMLYVPGDGSACPGVAEFVSVQTDVAGPVLLALSFLPVVVGALVGSQLIGREIEHRTAALGWSIDPARRRWVAERALAGTAIVGIVGLVVAIGSIALATSAYPGVDLWRAFLVFGLWGPPLLLRGLASLAVGFLVGAGLGRVMAAFLLSLALSAVVIIGIDVAVPRFMPTRIVDDPGGSRDVSAIYVEDRLRAANGEILTFAEGRATAPGGLDAFAMSDWIYSHYRQVAVVVPGDEAIMARIMAGILTSTVVVVGLLATVWVVSRRRPY